MKIAQIFFCGDSQEEIFFLCKDYARVRKNKEIEFFSRARIEEIFSKVEKNKNIILVVSFSRFKKLPILRLLEEVRKINPKNIIIGIDRVDGAEYVSTCDIVLIPQKIISVLEENEGLIRGKGFVPDIIPLTVFFSKNIHRYSRDNILKFFEEEKWKNEIDSFIKRA